MPICYKEKQHNVRVYEFLGYEKRYFTVNVNYVNAYTQGADREKHRAMSAIETSYRRGLQNSTDKKMDSSILTWFYHTPLENIKEQFIGTFSSYDDAIEAAEKQASLLEGEGLTNVRRRYLHKNSIFHGDIEDSFIRKVVGTSWKKDYEVTMARLFKDIRKWMAPLELGDNMISVVSSMVYDEYFPRDSVLLTRRDVFHRACELVREIA